MSVTVPIVDLGLPERRDLPGVRRRAMVVSDERVDLLARGDAST
jgi:hypothetical protein